MNIYDDYEQNRKIIKLEEEIRTLKNKIEFLTICLNDRDKSIALGKKENRKLEEENKKIKEDFDNYKKKVSEDMKIIIQNQIENINLFGVINRECKKLEQENKKLKNLKIGGKTVEERIEIDKGVIREF